jgi:thioredoxin reductase (NADPH)
LALATGGLARPRKLGIPGEDLPHVSHYPDDPHRYFRTRLLVVGGMNSALETALRAFHTGAQVTLSYRGPTIERGLAKRFLEAEVMELARQGRMRLVLGSMPVEITPSHVVLAPTRDGVPGEGPRTKEPADFVLLCTGYEADVRLFEMLGAELAGDQRAPVYREETMETTVPGLYVAGTVVGGTQKRFEHFIETSHVHVDRIVAALRAQCH